jgi:hypothetical protein
MSLPLKVALHGSAMDESLDEIRILLEEANRIISRPNDAAFVEKLVTCSIGTVMGTADPRVRSYISLDGGRILQISRPTGPLMPSGSRNKPAAIRSSIKLAIRALSVIEQDRDLDEMERLERLAQLVRATTGRADIDFVAPPSPWAPASLQSPVGDILSSDAFDAFVSSRFHPFIWISIIREGWDVTIRMSAGDACMEMDDPDAVGLMRIASTEGLSIEDVNLMLVKEPE